MHIASEYEKEDIEDKNFDVEVEDAIKNFNVGDLTKLDVECAA